MRNIAIIPARSGSKGLKDKNIKLLNGKPLLAYSIEAAIKSGIFDRVYVSTDSKIYADISREYGAHIPFLRPEQLSTDTAKSWEVVLDALHRFEEMGERFDMVTLLQPTSPLRDAEEIIKAYEEYQAKKAKAVVSVCEMEHSPLWGNILPKSLSMDQFVKAQGNLPRQSLETFYRINGAIYMLNIKFLKEDMNIYRQGCFAYIMDTSKSIDIDEECMRSVDMGDYYRVLPDGRDLNYDKFFVQGQVHTMANEAYTSHNTRRLNVDETVEKILTTDYVKDALKQL